MTSDYTQAVTAMMEPFYQTVSEGRVSAYVRKLKDFPIDVVRRACARGVESRDTCPSLAYLLAVSREMVSESGRQAAQEHADQADWLDFALDQGRPWVDRRTGRCGVHHWAPEERDSWRRWVRARTETPQDRAWTPNEALQAVQGIEPLDWTPRRILEGRGTKPHPKLAGRGGTLEAVADAAVDEVPW